MRFNVITNLLFGFQHFGNGRSSIYALHQRSKTRKSRMDCLSRSVRNKQNLHEKCHRN